VPETPEFGLPDVLCVGQHDRDEVKQAVFLGCGLVADILNLTATQNGRRIEQAHLPADDTECDKDQDALQAECPAYDVQNGRQAGRPGGNPLSPRVGHV
jgi:hypothetical protein